MEVGPKNKISLLRDRRGQVAVEYILLLVVALTVASLVIRSIGNRNPDAQGLVVTRWQQVLTSIGQELPDQCKGPSCN